MRTNKYGEYVSGPKGRSYKYCGNCTQQLEGKVTVLDTHCEAMHGGKDNARFLKKTDDVLHTIYTNWPQHLEDPDNTKLLWKEDERKRAH